MDKEVTVTFKNLGNKYHWHISCGNYQMAGYGDDLEDAEYHAFKTLQGIPHHGTIHSVYVDGKKPAPVVKKEV